MLSRKKAVIAAVCAVILMAVAAVFIHNWTVLLILSAGIILIVFTLLVWLTVSEARCCRDVSVETGTASVSAELRYSRLSIVIGCIFAAEILGLFIMLLTAA